MNNTYDWYRQLVKPKWAPPSWIFGTVWTFLYVIVFISFGAVFYKVFNTKLSWIIIVPFILNLIFNLAFTPIQFGLKNNYLAAVDIVLVLTTLVWALFVVWNALPELRWVVYVNIPYLLWVSFATVLQLKITYLNK